LGKWGSHTHVQHKSRSDQLDQMGINHHPPKGGKPTEEQKMKESHGYRNNPNETDQESAREIEELNLYWSDRFDRIFEENQNLKEKLKSRDLNLAHLTDLLDQIEDVKS